jgi:hypothetical protein
VLIYEVVVLDVVLDKFGVRAIVLGGAVLVRDIHPFTLLLKAELQPDSLNL